MSGAHQGSAQALKLLILTGCRKNEIVRLAWSEVDEDAACLRLGDTKTGRRVVQLPTDALAILAARKAQKRCAWVFPNEASDGARNNIEMGWRAARDASELPGVRVHDLRHSFAANAIAAGLSLSQLGKLMGHKAAATTARYAPVSDAVARAAADKVALRFGEILAAKDGLRAVK